MRKNFQVDFNKFEKKQNKLILKQFLKCAS